MDQTDRIENCGNQSLYPYNEQKGKKVSSGRNFSKQRHVAVGAGLGAAYQHPIGEADDHLSPAEAGGVQVQTHPVPHALQGPGEVFDVQVRHCSDSFI